MGFIHTDSGMDQLGFVRGPAMIYAAPMTTAPPQKIGDVIKTTTSGVVSEVQTLTITGTPTGGTFKLSFRGVVTAAIAFNAIASAVQSALELLSTIGTGGVTCSGGPLPGTPVVITFANQLANMAVPTIQPVQLAFTGGTTPAVTVAETTPGLGQYDPIGAWFSLGGTKDGVSPTFNDGEEEFTIDQSTAAIGALPNSHEWGLTTSLVETTLANMAFAWDMGPVTLITVSGDTNEQDMGMGTPTGRTQRRLAIIHRREVGNVGLLRMHFLRITQRQAGNESSLTYAAQGEQQRVPLRMRAMPDQTITDPYRTMGYMRDQVPT